MEKDTDFHLSYSRIAVYDDCPKRYKFIYVDKLPTMERSYFSFGNSIHKALEIFYHPEKNFVRTKKPPLEYLLKLLDEHWISAGYRTEYQEKKAKEEALQILRKLYRETIFGFHPAYLVEKSFSFRLGEFKVVGKIDRIDQTSDGYIIIDYKTSRTLPRFFKEIDLLQPIIYYIGAKEFLGLEKVDYVSLYFVRFNKKVKFDISEELLKKGKGKIIQVGEAIQRSEFPTKADGSCSTCEFKNICPAFSKNLTANSL